MPRRDLILLHPPSVYDFRERPFFFGPISDVIPSSPVFEMYPIGITSIAEYLERNGYNVQIINLAYRMLQDPHYDPEKVIRRLKARYFGIDFHWLPHVHGCLEVAKLIKKYHPECPVILGGLSASYYHRELITYPWVDFVIRGDSTEEPVLQLLRVLDKGEDLGNIPNLTWMNQGKIVSNPIEFVPCNLDYAHLPAYRYIIHSIFKYASLQNVIPYQGWLDYPMTTLLTSRGCLYNCVFCGGSSFSFKKINKRSYPAFRSPEKLIEDIRCIRRFSRAPIFVVHDLRQGGEEYVERFLQLVSRENVGNEFIFELFSPASDEYFKKLSTATFKYSLQISLESHLEHIRKEVGKFATLNREIENTLHSALKHGCRKIDIFFTVGLPHQTYKDVIGVIDYCRSFLQDIKKGRIVPFISPLAPFLDPGSPAFEDPTKYGYHKFCHSLEDHRQALLQPTWKQALSYETRWMSREEIVKATYDVAFEMNRLKYKLGLIDKNTHIQINERIARSVEVLDKMDGICNFSYKRRKVTLIQIQDSLGKFGEYSICGKDELKWPDAKGFRNVYLLALLGYKLLWQISRLYLSFVRKIMTNFLDSF